MSEDLQSLKLRGFFRSLDLETLLVLEPLQKVPLPLLFAKIYYCITLIFDLGKRPFILILNPSLQQSLLNPCNFVLVEFSSNKYKCYKSNPLTLDEPWKSSDEERQKSAPAMTGFFFLLFFWKGGTSLETICFVKRDIESPDAGSKVNLTSSQISHVGPNLLWSHTKTFKSLEIIHINHRVANGRYFQADAMTTVVCMLVRMKFFPRFWNSIHIGEINDTSYERAACFHWDEAKTVKSFLSFYLAQFR